MCRIKRALKAQSSVLNMRSMVLQMSMFTLFTISMTFNIVFISLINAYNNKTLGRDGQPIVELSSKDIIRLSTLVKQENISAMIQVLLQAVCLMIMAAILI